MDPSGDLLPPDIRAHLSTHVFAQRIYYISELDSTNRLAVDMAKSGEPEGTLVIADHQTRGRGRYDRSWVSPARRNLLFSLILRPHVPARKMLAVTLACALSIAETLEPVLGRAVGVKWPNDVLVGDDKICGILSEGSTSGDDVAFVVVGVGINVNMTADEFPAELRRPATSCRVVTGRAHERATLLARVVEGMERTYGDFAGNGFETLVERYDHRLADRGRVLGVSTGGKTSKGYVVGVGDDGGLLIRLGGGKSMKTNNSRGKRTAVCIDVGNTSVKVAVFDSAGIETVTVEPTGEPGVVGRIQRTLRDRRRSLRGDVDAILCTVVPEMASALGGAVRAALGVRPFTIRHTGVMPFTLAVEHPSKVGADRLCAAAGVYAGRRGNRIRHAIVVDIGSAVTVDLLSDARFCGGLIFVGPVLGLNALGEYARRLPYVNPVRMESTPESDFSDTEPSMALGARVSTVGAIKEAARMLARASGHRPPVYVTGGWARAITRHLPPSWRHDPDLVTKGMIVIRELNR
ncbi:MAG: biotin--[acetyl-CoA-carboxylase] ligase [bacterium]